MTGSEQAPLELLERLDKVLMLAALVQPRGGEWDGVGTAADARLFLTELLSLTAAASPRVTHRSTSPLEFAGHRRRRTSLRRLPGSCTSFACLTVVVLQVSIQAPGAGRSPVGRRAA